MNYNRSVNSNSTVTIRLMCAIVFIMFAFSWLYFFQADTLSMAQHKLSGGVTRYNPAVGAVIITLLLLVLQVIVYGIVRLNKRFHALTYVPSMTALAVLSDVTINTDGSVRFLTHWPWIAVILIVWLLLIWAARLMQQVEENLSYSLFSRPMWINMLIMSVVIMCVAGIGNSNAVFHYRMSAEGLIDRGQYQAALEVGKESLESDASLLMLRMYSLARENTLGEHLFEYPISGSVSQILPTNGKTCMLLCSVDSLYRFMGARPARRMEPMTYLSLLASRDSVTSRQVADYLLCGLLIDRQLDRFATEIGKYYNLDEQLPRHYREALTLYTHVRVNPILDFNNNVANEDWDDLQKLEKCYSDSIERKGRVEDKYRGTYWYYYEYCR